MLSLKKSKMVRGGFGLVAILASAWIGGGCTNTETIQGPNPLDTEDGFCQGLATAAVLCAPGLELLQRRPMDKSAIQTDTTHCVAAASRPTSATRPACPITPRPRRMPSTRSPASTPTAS